LFICNNDFAGFAVLELHSAIINWSL